MASSKRRKKRRPQNNSLVLKLLLLVMLVLVVFEGQLIRTMLTQSRSGNITVTGSTEAPADDSGDIDSTITVQTEAIPAAASNSIETGLAGIARSRSSSVKTPASSPQTPETEVQTEAPYVDPDAWIMDLPYVVKEQETSVDDSYFADAVFIGDSRMEGFRNASGITQGDFLTSVGMAMSSLGDTKVSTSEGTITVYQGLSGKQYGKIYLMLGANDLGYYPMDNFPTMAEGVLEQIHKLQPNAAIYICSVVYVEEDKVTTSYVNNANVITVNNYLLQACEDLSYCYYLNLNEIFSNGWQSLIYGASADGVHLNTEYLVQMLTYMKSHYIVWDTVETGSTESETQAQTDEAADSSGDEDDVVIVTADDEEDAA